MSAGRFFLAVILAVSAIPLFAGPAISIYRSNNFGMQLEPIPAWRRDESTWILQVSPTAKGEVRRLFQGGKEVRSWEISPTAGSGREERELADGVLAARRVYGPTGDLQEEDQYSKGKLTQKSLYTYASSRVSRVRVTGADGSVAYTEDYLYTSRGSLREVRRIEGKSETADSAFVTGSSGLSEERNQVGDETFVGRYDARGRAVERERSKGGQLVSREDFVYRGDTDHLESSVEKRLDQGRVISRSYDTAGRLQGETVSEAGKVVRETTYTRDDKGRVTKELRRSPSGLEEWRTTLDSAGKAARVEYYRRGSLEKVTLYGKDNLRTEEMYQGGAVFLKVYFDGDRRLREEVYEDGKLVRQRTSP